MGRGKMPHGLVPNARNGLMKKAREFSVLCGVDTCVVVFPEAAAAGGDRPTAPEKKEKEKKLGLCGKGELLKDLSKSQLRSLQSILGDRVDLAKRKLAAMNAEKRVARAGAVLGPCNEEGPSVDAVPQKTAHQASSDSTPEWFAGAQPDARCSYSVDGCWDTPTMEDDSTFFHTFLTEAMVF
ncbi:hypothetical protein ACJRO7_031362 [Eucalyptus globulus]|uniref:MADS-box domain-containing protein n=1 Tax=Eucalyptus globulus TaxID=34317 RepID=A0ABD3JEG6_EUCGL